MARKAEIGIEYFPINTDIIHNPKIKLVVAEFGSKTTWAVLLPLLCKIYREKGYWIDWLDEDCKLLFAKDEAQVELNAVNEIVHGCIRRSFFDKRVYDMFGVLTSDRIQDNYLVAKARNKQVGFIKEFGLKNEEGEYVYKLFNNVNIIDLDVDIITKNVDTGTQKEKEKEKKNETLASEQEKYSGLEKSKGLIVEFIRQHKPKFISPYVDLWNIFSDERKTAKVKTITDMRKKKFNVRINEPPFDFIAILSKAKDSEFLMTRSFFTFDWIIENQDNYVQVLEGKYNNNKKAELNVSDNKQKRQQLEERTRQLAKEANG